MSSDNPFAAMSDGSSRDGDAINKAPAEVDFFGLFGRAASLITDNLEVLLVPMVVLIAVNLASIGLNVAISFGTEASGDETIRLAGQLTSNVVSIVFGLINLYLTLGFYRMLIRLDRGQEAEQDMMWGEGSNFLSAIGTTILMSLIVLILAIPTFVTIFAGTFGAVYQGIETGDFSNTIGIILGSSLVALLLFIPAYIVQLGLQYSVISVVDLDGNPIEALQQSWRVTTGRKLFLFGQGLVAGLLALTLYIVTCFFGAPLVIIGMAALQVATYNAFKHASDAEW
jgi:hypothetical protein